LRTDGFGADPGEAAGEEWEKSFAEGGFCLLSGWKVSDVAVVAAELRARPFSIPIPKLLQKPLFSVTDVLLKCRWPRVVLASVTDECRYVSFKLARKKNQLIHTR
jgi:hypothetical protein